MGILNVLTRTSEIIRETIRVVPMKIEIHPEAQKAFNKRALDLLGMVQSRAVESKEPSQANREDSPEFNIAAQFDLTDVRNFTSFTEMPDGSLSEKYRRVGGFDHGFETEGYRELRLLAERIQQSKGISSKVSQQSLEEAVFEWAIDQKLGRTQQPLCERLIEEFEARVKERWVWVALFGIYTNFDFDLGRTSVHPFRAKFFETWEASLKHRGALDDKAKALITETRRKLQGSAACTIKVEAEPIRAREIGLEEAEATAAILRMYLPSSTHPLVRSYCQPMQLMENEVETCLTIEDNEVIAYHFGPRDRVKTWTLDEGLMNDMRAIGLGALHDLYLLESKSEFQRELLNSAFIFSRSSLQSEPSDRLIYVFRALDSFLLQDGVESIQQNIADRIAFTVGQTVEERVRIVKLVKHAYGMRSGWVHHAESIQEIDLLSEFLQVAFQFYVWLIIKHQSYATRADFWADIEKKKYGGIEGNPS